MSGGEAFGKEKKEKGRSKLQKIEENGRG